MKTTTTKKIFSFILFLSGMFSTTLLNAQNCSGNKVWACRYDECGRQECKCVNANNVQSWMATIPNCNLWHPNCCDGWRLGQDDAAATSLNAYPNPISPGQSGTTISFSVGQTENVLIQILDVNGRVIASLANAEFQQGNYEITWNAEVNSGIYFLQFQSAENFKTIKLSVTN